MAPFYSILFATSFCQDNSSRGFPYNGEHLTRSQTIPLYTISPDTSDSQLHVDGASLQFNPLIFWTGSGQGTGMVMAEVSLCVQ